MRKSHSLLIAESIIRLIEVVGAEEEIKDFTIDTYSNCREQGYAITNYVIGTQTPKKVAFAENRNSDNITVYAGTNESFEIAGNIPTDKTYNNAKNFARNEILNAVMFIIAHLTGK